MGLQPSHVLAVVLLTASLSGRERSIQAQGVPPDVDRGMLLDGFQRNSSNRESNVSAVDRATAAFVRRQPQIAFEILTRARQADPDLPPADVVLAKLYLKSQDVKSARMHLDRAATRAPQDPEAYLILAELALDEGRLTEAQLLFERALSLTPRAEQKRKATK